jgi:NAD(P)H-hydrate epimerase
MLNASQRPILSLDLPSGIYADTGRILGAAVRATHTLACGTLKPGNVLYPGYEYCGKLALTPMSLPPALTKSDSLPLAINHPLQLPPRSVTGHKGTFGDVLIIAGAGNYYGAPYFSAATVLKAGGGYSRLAAPASVIPVIAAKGSEMVFVPQQETESGNIALRNKAALLELAEKVDFVILGPGLSLHEETQQLVRELTTSLKKPLLIDGDGITALCQDVSLLRHREAETILTPHLGEMARLTRMSVHDIAAEPLALLQRTARDLNAYIVMKGAHSLIGYPDGRVFVNMSGNSGMGTAGSGDVLTGTIAAMFGLGLLVPGAVREGVFMHGFSGDLAAQEKGEDGITAQDVLDFLPLALKLARDTLPEDLQHRYLLTLP